MGNCFCQLPEETTTPTTTANKIAHRQFCCSSLCNCLYYVLCTVWADSGFVHFQLDVAVVSLLIFLSGSNGAHLYMYFNYCIHLHIIAYFLYREWTDNSLFALTLFTLFKMQIFMMWLNKKLQRELVILHLELPYHMASVSDLIHLSMHCLALICRGVNAFHLNSTAYTFNMNAKMRGSKYLQPKWLQA